MPTPEFSWLKEERGKVILVSIGHTEQHGFHLLLAVIPRFWSTLSNMPASVTRTLLLPLLTSIFPAHKASQPLNNTAAQGLAAWVMPVNLETSLMLHLRPELVDMSKVVDETDFIATPNYYMDWVEGGAKPDGALTSR